MKLIILGMDNTGKTTLSGQLSKELNLKVINSCGPKFTKEQMDNFILENILSPEDLIFERFCFFEEMVYGPILRGKSKFNFRDNLFNNIKNSDAKIIYCRPNKKTIKNWQQREQMEGVIDNSDKLLRKYDRVIKKAQKHGMKVIKYNYKKETVFDVIAKI